MSRPVWSAADLDVRPMYEHDPAAGVFVRRAGEQGASWLGPELSRSLAGWLLWQAGDRPHPADPDRVRVAVDDARRSLRERSSAAETSEDFRAGLAWADHALDAIAAAAGAPTERTTR
jgi:hypothetical protein